MSTLWDAPNQQVVRGDESPPWEEGTGNGTAPDPQAAEDSDEPQPANHLEQMTKAQLLEHAETLGLDVHEDLTKAEIRNLIDEAG